MSYIPNTNRKSLVATSISAQPFATANSAAAVTGTEITYTPSPNSTHVIYRCQFAFGYGSSTFPYLGFTLEDNSGVTTAGSFITGGSYTITSPENTDFTAVGAADNDVGTVFTATGAGSGIGTATPGDIPGYVWEKYGYGTQPEDLISLVAVLPAWAGSRSLRIKAQTWNAGAAPSQGDAKLHQHQLWEGSSAPFEFCPSVSCTSVLNGTP